MKKLLFLILLVLAAYFFWRWWRSDAETARGQELFYDRVWVDHEPKSDTDTFQVFAAITEEPVGIFQSLSQWKGEFELFKYRPGGDGKVSIGYPQTGKSETASYRAARCKDKGFEFCLEISGASRGVKRYYSRSGWEIDSHSLAGARAIAGHLASPAR